MTLRSNLALAAALGVLLTGCAGETTVPLTSAPPPGSSGPTTPALDRLYAMRPIKGMIYKAAPHNYDGSGTGLYFDSDFVCDDFKELWGPTGRNDLKKLKDAGVNFLHIYDWNQPGSGRNHRPFMDRCAALGISIAPSWSKYYVLQVQAKNPDCAQWARNMVAEVYPGKKRHKAAVIWTLGNEWENGFEQTPDGLAQSAKLIIEAENAAGIPDSERLAFTHPVTFGIHFDSTVEGAGATLKIKEAFLKAGLADAWSRRYIASANSFNPGSDLARWAGQFSPAIGGSPFMIYELGKEIGGDVTNEEQQGAFYKAQFDALMPIAKGTGPYLGQCSFSYVNEFWKGGTEAQFGMYRIGKQTGTGHTNNGSAYPIDQLIEKPSFKAMRNAYTAP